MRSGVENIKIQVSVSSASTFEVTIGSTASVKSLKLAIVTPSGIQADKQILKYKGQVLEDQNGLNQYNIGDGSNVDLEKKKSGSSHPSSGN